jgi:hypothetical protein
VEGVNGKGKETDMGMLPSLPGFYPVILVVHDGSKA